MTLKVYLDTVYFTENWKLITENTVTKISKTQNTVTNLLPCFSQVGWSMKSVVGPTI